MLSCALFLYGCKEAGVRESGDVTDASKPGAVIEKTVSLTEGSQADKPEGASDEVRADDSYGQEEAVKDKEIAVINEAVIPDTGAENSVSEDEFYITEITDEIFDRIYGKSFKEDCTLPREDLRYLHVLNKDKDGNVLEGEMIVNKHIAEDVLEILRELYDSDYPIEKIRLVDEYDADDDKSMKDNNSSSFNYRTVPGSKKMSKHSMGMAIDINPRYNPYIRYKNGQSIITPENGIEYADREAEYDYKIEKGDLCYNLFIEHGFEWGGAWNSSKDYQHFDIPDAKINEWYP
ncbi:MAG: M15 family metallopeptidase [Lachnospiraceae bacterium]|nr:M15 family metallopeptidase [Lachnospiraceae bacterium]